MERRKRESERGKEVEAEIVGLKKKSREVGKWSEGVRGRYNFIYTSYMYIYKCSKM